MKLTRSKISRPRICAGSAMGKELCRIQDEYGLVIVTQRGDKRVLSFDSNLEQSSIYMSKPYYLSHEYTQIMLLGLLFVKAKNITLLGLGGGGLVHCFHHFFPRIKIQAVELRQTVIDVAHDWFELPKTDNLNVHCTDAHNFLKSLGDASTDLILSDLYGAEGMSEVQAQLSFIDSAYRVLSEQGCLVINFHHMPASAADLMQAIRNAFSVVYICDVFKGNLVMFCCKSSEEIINSIELKMKVQSLIDTVEMPLMYYFKQMRVLVENR